MRNLSCFLVLFILVSCGSKQEYDDSLIFRYNSDSGVQSLDPAFARDQYNIWAVNQIYDGLVQMDNDLKVQASIAHNWNISDSGKTYTFHLKGDVYFHENVCFGEVSTRTVTAKDFKFSFERLVSKELAAPGSWVFKNVERFEAPNDSTFIIHLKSAFSPFLGILSMKYCSVLAPEAVEFYGPDYRKNPVGTGPFYLKLWVENEKLVLRKNQQYFEKDEEGTALPYLEAVAVSFVPDKQSAFLEFIKGKLDFISGIDASYKDELLTQDGVLQEKYANRFLLYRQPYLNTEYLAFLVDSSKIESTDPLAQIRIRQAINYGFDRHKMMRYLRNNIGNAATSSMIPNGLPAFDPERIPGYDYDVEKAKELLIQAGFPNGKGLPPIQLLTNASYLDLCEYIQGELSKIGIEVKVEVTPPATLRQAVATSKVGFFRASWIGDYPDSENYLSLFYSKNWAPNGPNYTHFKNQQFDEWYIQAAAETEDSLRLRLYQKMDSLVISQAPVVPLYYDQVLRFYPKTITGLEGNALNLLTLKTVRKD